MQIDRLFGIVYLLIANKGLQAKQLAEHFEVSKRTILRDIDSLCAAGIPLYTLQGKGGGIFLPDNYLLDKTVISPQEQQDILFSLQSLATAKLNQSPDLLKRLESLFAGKTPDWIEIDFSYWGNNESDQLRASDLKQAIIHSRAISFVYYSSSKTAIKRKAYPLKLWFKARAWYLQAYCLCRKTQRSFRVSRMKDIRLLNEVFDRDSYPLTEVDKNDFSPKDQLAVQLHIEAAAAYRLYDDFSEDQIKKQPDGSFIIDLQIDNVDWFSDYILSFGTAAEVVLPKSLRILIAKKAALILEKYSG